MPLDILLLILRILIVLALYAFLGSIFFFLWKDIQQNSERAAQKGQFEATEQGHLTITEILDESLPFAPGQRFPLYNVTTLGRSPINAIVLPDNFASTTHAQILFREGQWWLEDLGSRNGTTINEILIDSPVILAEGDIIGIGSVKLRFEVNKNKPLREHSE